MNKEIKITVETTIDAPLQTTWDAYNNPEDIKQWNSAHPEWHCPSSKNDLRTGGKFNHRMEARDGSMGFDFEGVYDKVEPHREISYSMSDGRRASTLFSEVDGKTKVQTTFDAEMQNDPEFQKQGWQAILDNFGRYVEGKKV